MATGSRLGSGALGVLGTGTTKDEPSGKKPSPTSLAFLDAIKQEQEQADVAALPRIPLNRIAPHPDNPKRRSNPNDPKTIQLAKSIKEHDFLQPLTLAPRADLVAAEPELDELIDKDATYVSLIGHRRTVAGVIAGKKDAPAVVRTTNLSRRETQIIFLHENRERDDITPIEEAESFRRLADQGMSQPQIAEVVGEKQPYVNKTLKLLELPGLLREAINHGELNKADAHRLRALSDQAALQVWASHQAELATLNQAGSGDAPTPIQTLINRHRAAAEQAKRDEDLRALLLEQGIKEIDPVSTWPGNSAAHRVVGADLARLTSDGVTVAGAALEGGELVYYREDVPAEQNESAETTTASRTNGGSSDKGAAMPTAETSATSQVREAEAASKARAEACRRLLQSEVPGSHVQDILVDAMLHSSPKLDRIITRQVSAWLDRDLKPGQDIFEQVASRTHRQNIAVAVALASVEQEASHQRFLREPWPQHIRRYVERLRELGHLELTEFDSAKLSEPARP